MNPLNPARPLCLVHPYTGQTISLATRHGKERALARPFHRGLGAELFLAPDFDTDELGTFCAERPRAGSAAQVCRTKAELGMQATGLTLGLASEGSFGPHPLVPLLAVGEEWMTFVDHDRGLVIVERLLARRTNFRHRLALPAEDLGPWLDAVGFPAHGLLVRPHRPVVGHSGIVRGIQDPVLLAEAIRLACRDSGDDRALVETDMRAHMNPTRMASIRTLAFRLVRRLLTACPACGTPGWGRVRSESGLPCSWCGGPTDLTSCDIFGCAGCDHEERLSRSDGLLHADPGQCPRCNP